MATSESEERAELWTRWRPAPDQPTTRVMERLVANEFLPASTRAVIQEAALRDLLTHAAAQVPYYRARFAAATARGPVDSARALLARLPPLTKSEVQQHGRQLAARSLPPGHRRAGWSRTSGTTGEPTIVAHSLASSQMFVFLKHRELRWFRLDPAGTLAAIRPYTELPRDTGHAGTLDDPIRQDAWPYVGPLARTGRFVGLRNTTPIADQLAFLRRERPDYLIMQSAGLEHVALAADGPLPGLAACQAISQTLTPTMRATVEGRLGVPVHMNYGLNEIGLVASRCPQAGRYHVHDEHCLVEVVDANGRPTPPGEQGRVLVTTLTNTSMPLIRYDADDLAIAVDGPCPCGRTLPAFGEVVGRYRRIACLPEGTWPRWGAILQALYELPDDLGAALRRYQAKQHADGSWELRIESDHGTAPAIGAWVRPRFEAAADGAPPPLVVVATDAFEHDGRGKFQNFLSDFVPPPDGAPGNG